MAGAWQRGLSFAKGIALGSDYTDSAGRYVASSGTTFTKGAWVQLIASTTINSSWTLISVMFDAASAGGNWAIDIGIGNVGNEQVIVSNLPNTAHIMIPLRISSGTRVVARSLCSSAYGDVFVQMQVFADTFTSGGSSGSVTTYGFNTATSIGVAVDGGSIANSKGSYVQIASALTSSIAGFFLGFDIQNTEGSGVGDVPHLTDIAIGSSGSEVVILPDLQHTLYYYGTGNGAGTRGPVLSPYFPLPIQAGVRVAARTQSRTSTSPDRKFGLTFYGVRQ